jgi:hypothetical protein
MLGSVEHDEMLVRPWTIHVEMQYAIIRLMVKGAACSGDGAEKEKDAKWVASSIYLRSGRYL